MYEFLAKGGPVMWPLLACSIVALGVVFERLFFWLLLIARTDRERINRIFSLTEAGQFEQAVKEGKDTKCMVSRILSVGLAHRDYGLLDCLEAGAMQEIEKMKRNLSILDTIITLSPLLGILGTVTGIIASFDLLGAAGICTSTHHHRHGACHRHCGTAPLQRFCPKSGKVHTAPRKTYFRL